MDQDGDARGQGGFAPVVQGQGLARLDLAAGVGDAFTVDRDHAGGDQGFGLAARAYPGLAQPFIDADRL
ncbi:hypothetical protein D3C79_1057100 [compost metagenome]